jgi:hypothetical protein
MDLGLFARVLWRFKVVILVGFVAAIALATLSVAKIGPHGLTYRQSPLWQSTTRLGLTSEGFNWTSANNSVDLTGRTMLFASLINSDPVRRLIRKSGAPKGELAANGESAGWGGDIKLPLLDITAVAETPDAAMELATAASAALSTYLRGQQREDGIAGANRIDLETVQAAGAETTTIFRSRSKTIPILVFGVVMFATIGLAFLLENIRPRIKAGNKELAQTPELLPARRSA